MSPPSPRAAEARTAFASHANGVLDTTPDERFDRIARLAADLLDTPVALVSLVDGDRLYLKSTHGLELKEILLKDSFCAHSIDRDDVLVVEDARADARFHDNLYVTGPPHVRFYAAVPLTSPAGRHLGTLSVLAFEPRTLTERHHDHLRTLGAMAVDELELSRQISETDLSRLRTQVVIDAMRSGFFVVDAHWRITHVNGSIERQLGQTRAQIVGRNLWEAFPDLRDTPFEAQYRLAMRERTPVRFESPHVASGRWYEVKADPFEDGLSVHFDDVTERRHHAEEVARLLAREQALTHALREREETFRALAENSPDVIARYDRDLRLRYVNPAIESQTGLARGQLLGKRTTELHEPSIVGQSLEDALRTILSTGRPLNRSFAFQTPQGVRHFEMALVPERNDRDEIVSVLTRASDVTERKRAEEQLRLLESAVAHAQDGVIVTDATLDGDGPRILYVNDAHLRLVGYRREEVVGQTPRLFQGPDTSPDARARIRAALERAEPVEQEILNYTKAGNPYWIEMLIAPVVGPDGQPTHFVSTQRDITERKAAAERFLADMARYRALSRLISAYAFAYRVDGERLVSEWTTETVVDVLGFTNHEVGEAGARSFIHPDDLARWDARNRLLANGQEATDDFRVRRRAGDYRWIRVHTFPEFDAAGRVVRVYGAAQDITDQKESEAELIAARDAAEEAARLKDAFLANMSHEIRTPLTAILGFSELLHEEVGPEAAPIVEYIEGAGRRLMETLTSVLDLSQLRAGVMETHPVPTDVVALARETVEILSRLAERKGLTLSLVDAPAALVLDVDAGALGRVLTNLINNAVKFTDAGSVEVSVAARGGAVRFSVHDTGIGISDTFLPHLFDEFRQESTGLTRRHEGAGLGLAITKALVDLMGGTIAVESAPGAGTTFVVTLPCGADAATGEADETEAPSPTSPEHTSNGRPPRVLVVEDNKPTRDLLERVLGRHFDLVAASNAPHTRAVCAAQPWEFALVLLDINLGEGGSGLDLLREFRSRPDTHATRFVAMTAYALPGDEERMLAAGFDAYVAKPFTRADLYHVIAPALRTKAP